ncbi:TOMM precursor leader peptide-binding protein [Pseudonocardia sp. KRD291]|uniref:TOMM precursor leader peptide-binding protein n=1 Tax=Pseudonocardia sp. KRD291 TaxID=2792007 RepID=UPI001C4A36B2|nr:TOMM precursor leader peptide-binding protein [Pseudonocardia sp. KRD291]MBW0101965.1 TOMM precursor leader peptide-binding protein [Pseudonocardia sp. KRD291]
MTRSAVPRPASSHPASSHPAPWHPGAPEGLPARVVLAPHLFVLVRGPDSRQVGLDPVRGLVLEDLCPAGAAMLDELGPAPVDTADLLRRAAGRGADPGTGTALLAALLGAGLLRDARTPDRVARRRAGSHVQVRGDGPLALAVSAALSRAGVGAVHARTSGPVGPPDLLIAGLPARALGRDRSRVAAELIAATAPGTRAATPGRTPPDLVVLTDAQARRLDEADALTGRAVEHLVVRVRDGRGVVGPLVLPGRSACLRCLDLHRTGLDPGWPALTAALADRTGSAEPGVLAATAALGAAQALLALDGPTTGGPPPPSLDATLELDLDTAGVVTRVWAAHPGCPCGAAVPVTAPAPGDRARPAGAACGHAPWRETIRG